MSQPRVLLLALSPVLRFGIRGMLRSTLAPERVAEADTALQAAAIAPELDPTLIVIQFALPGVNGLLAARMLRDLCPAAKITVLSDDTGEAALLLAVRHGVDALLPAAIDPAGFTRAIDDLLDGGTPLADHVLDRPELAARVFAAVRAPGAAAPVLSPREIALLDGLVRGVSTREIGELTGMGEAGLRPVQSALFAKLDAIDRTTAIVAAVRGGLVVLDHHLPAPPIPGGEHAGLG